MSTHAALKGFLGLAAIVMAGAMPALAGDRWEAYEDAGVPWYDQEPWIGTGPGYYYSQHPDHIPAYPVPLTGYAVPVFSTHHPVVHDVVVVDEHVEWCLARYRSYDVETDTFQPDYGPRRHCRSPY